MCEGEPERARASQSEPESGSLWLSLAPSGSLRLSLALRICLQSPCLAHKALARIVASLLRYSTLISPVAVVVVDVDVVVIVVLVAVVVCLFVV